MGSDMILERLKEKWKQNFESRFEFFLNLTGEERKFTKDIYEAFLISLEQIYKDFIPYKDKHFDIEILSKESEKYDQRIAEVLFNFHLRRTGFVDIKSKNEGPDFFATKNGHKFCFEVVTPTPNQEIKKLINKKELNDSERILLYKERLLTVTSSISRKLEDLERFKEKGIVNEDENYIIVINDSLLLPYDAPWYGVINNVCISDSTLPISVDATMGRSEIDFDMELYNENYENTTSKSNIKLKKMVVKNNISVTFNNQTSTGSDSFLYINVKEMIPTRKASNTIIVDISESTNAAGFYQITLREDIFFLLVFEHMRTNLPKSALISRTQEKYILRKNIPYYVFYNIHEDKVQPDISPAYILGKDLDHFNNQSIYNNLYSKFIKKK
ncbi:hypothetical protein [Enterobacter sp. Bisph1]|uniref:hypothetical protein n=1 Tax=Enterobacter sp. Bisph1 TaxID=1274399 RepID=UPI000AE710F4|nr:hypothetical protein [Enterobacter sp. Bisph1]